MTTTESTPSTPPSSPSNAPKPIQERRLFDFYRPEEGHRGRALIGIAIATLTVYGCVSFYEWLPVETWHKPLPYIGTALGDEFTISGAILFAGSIALAALIGIFKLINFPKFVDFLIDTENELKKVSWASRRQVVTESIVVVVTVLILGTYVFLIDSILILLKRLPWDNFWNKIL